MVDSLRDGLNLKTEPEVKEKEPKYKATFTTPYVELSGTTVRLVMHTDNVGNFIRFFRGRPETPNVFVKVRLPTDEQWEKIQASPRYRVHIEGRWNRRATANGQESLGFSRPLDIIPGRGGLRNLLMNPHSPDTIREQDGIDYKTGFVSVASLISLFNQNQKSIERFIAASTELEFGSDEIQNPGLTALARELTQYLAEQDGQFGNLFSQQIQALLKSQSFQNNIPQSNFNITKNAPSISKSFDDFSNKKVGYYYESIITLPKLDDFIKKDKFDLIDINKNKNDDPYSSLLSTISKNKY